MRNDRRHVVIFAVIAAMLCTIPVLALAGTENDAPTTPATTFHGLPGNNPGHGGSSANPQGEGVNGGNGIHNIAGVQANGAADTGQPPACTSHGGLDAANKNCED